MNKKYREKSTGKIFTVKTTGNMGIVLVHNGEERIVGPALLKAFYESV
jgi:hypothetical protein